MKARNKLTQVLFFVVCLLLVNSAFAKQSDEVVGPVIAVKRTTTMRGSEVLQKCTLSYDTGFSSTSFKCIVADERRAETDVYPATSTGGSYIPNIPNAKSLFTSSISVYAGGGQGVRVQGMVNGKANLDEIKGYVTQVFAENNLEGKQVEFVVHVVKPKKD